MISLIRHFGLAVLALVTLFGTALVLTLPAVAAASASHREAPAHAPMQPTPPGVPPGLVPAGTASSTNWSGYAATGTTFSSVSSSWVEPTATCPSGTQYSSAWVGLDGFSSRTVEQTGTDSDCAGATPRYFAWYEMYPASSVLIAEPVGPGDQMNASVTASTSITFALTISDATKGWTKTFTKTLATAKRSSAEVIEEAPCCTAAGGILPLADFGKINFTNAHANGQPIGNFTTTRIDMTTPTGIAKATPSALSSGAAFSVTWHHR
jgi:hypothetical protein